MTELYENKNQILNDSIDRIVVELINKKSSSDSAGVVLMTGCSALAGTTTVSIASAIAVANTHRKTVLIDCDVRKSAKYKKLNKDGEAGLADYLSDLKDISIESVIQETNIPDLSYIPCGICDEKPTRVLCSAKIKDLLDYCRANFDFVFLDLPSISIVPDSKALFSEVDGIVLITAIGETTKFQIKQAKQKISEYSEKYYGMIVNKVEAAEFKKNIQDYDYYFSDEKGEQNLRKRIVKKIEKK